MACQSVAAVMDEQALLGLNPNADARYRQRVRALAAVANGCSGQAASALMGSC